MQGSGLKVLREQWAQRGRCLYVQELGSVSSSVGWVVLRFLEFFILLVRVEIMYLALESNVEMMSEWWTGDKVLLGTVDSSLCSTEKEGMAWEGASRGIGNKEGARRQRGGESWRGRT